MIWGRRAFGSRVNGTYSLQSMINRVRVWSSLPLIPLCVVKVFVWVSLRSQVIEVFDGREKLVAYRLWLMRWVGYSSLPSGSLFTGRLEKLRHVEEGSGVFPHIERSTEWGTPPRLWSFISLPSLWSCSLCFRVPLWLWGIGEFGGRVRHGVCRVLSMGLGCWSSLPAGSLPADWLKKLRQVGAWFCPGMKVLKSGVPCGVTHLLVLSPCFSFLINNCSIVDDWYLLILYVL